MSRMPFGMGDIKKFMFSLFNHSLRSHVDSIHRHHTETIAVVIRSIVLPSHQILTPHHHFLRRFCFNHGTVTVCAFGVPLNIGVWRVVGWSRYVFGGRSQRFRYSGICGPARFEVNLDGGARSRRWLQPWTNVLKRPRYRLRHNRGSIFRSLFKPRHNRPPVFPV